MRHSGPLHMGRNIAAIPRPIIKLKSAAILGIAIILKKSTILLLGIVMFRFFSQIQFFPLLLGFSIGLFCIYILKPAPVVVIKYPNLDNVATTIYKDRNGTCFQYEVAQVDCDKEEDRIKPYPLQ